MSAERPRGAAPASGRADRVALLGARLLAQTRLREAAATFLSALHARGVVAAPIKGLVVSAQLYDDPLDRPFGDVDVLIGRRDLAAVRAIARDLGLRVVSDSKQLFTLNVVIPPGIPMDLRATIGPPSFARATAADVLSRAELVTDPRVVAVPFYRLDGDDHLALLLLDAVIDKFALRTELRKEDLSRALGRWLTSPACFAERARALGLTAVAWLGLTWLHGETSDPVAREVLRALEPVPRLPRALAGALLNEMRRAPYGPAARVGVRLLSDTPARGIAALALGALGTARFLLRHGSRSPWKGVLWDGRSEPRD